ncbi:MULTISPECIES: ABC transporter ATP-binding protein [Rheinheimera]|jgi:putative ABC transport system ATP-binding protein|uniref:Putative ABC transport system ATP-binding protein n=1 Tax=Rheinheimera pacifica TaxID=173990 RepID=A0A1H6JZ08_9GAMM|nr:MULTISPECIES: ABC transporter ATP-binding protein [Rheinheimera]KUM52156.1 phosphonate ABC transporter ATP-binding protein [Rheinheimera sp. EpRS3]SEH67879.1 putative ABC transport system ATP-binding protein [Rheinheimera pacifica]
MIQLQQLNRVFRTSELETTALNQIDLHIQQGDFVAIMGPSGCGKSTLLSILGMLDSPSSGAYLFQGTDIANYSEKQLAQLRKTQLGFVFQSFNLIDELTVFQNVELPLQYQGVAAGERKQRVEAILKRMQIDHRADHLPLQLSGGQQQRVAVARALVINPALILADEPTGNLDSKNSEEVMQMLRQLNHDGTTVVMVTHSEHESRYASRIVRMLDGQIITERAMEAKMEAKYA